MSGAHRITLEVWYTRPPRFTRSGGASTLRLMERVERDAAHLGLALFDMSPKQHLCLIGFALQYCAQDTRVFLVGGVNTVVAGEVEPTHDPYPARHIIVNPGDFIVARRPHKRRVKALIELAHRGSVTQSLA